MDYYECRNCKMFNGEREFKSDDVIDIKVGGKMSESIGMQLFNQRCEDIIRNCSTHDLTLLDLTRIAFRLREMSELTYDQIDKIQEDLETEGGENGSK